MAENTIKAGLDVSDIESGAKKAGVALRSIGKAAKDAGQQSAAGAAAVAAGYDKAGKEAERLTKKQERATQSIINSVQREIAVREVGVVRRLIMRLWRGNAARMWLKSVK